MGRAWPSVGVRNGTFLVAVHSAAESCTVPQNSEQGLAAMLHAYLNRDSDWGPLCVERGLTSSGPWSCARCAVTADMHMANLAGLRSSSILIFRGVRGGGREGRGCGVWMDSRKDMRCWCDVDMCDVACVATKVRSSDFPAFAPIAHRGIS